MVEFLVPELLEDAEYSVQFAAFRRWERALNYQVGWHYPLDLVWILHEVQAHVPPAATILDIGAGSGLLQYLLAASGYNVLSLDLLRRRPGRLPRAYFGIVDRQNETRDTEYTAHLLDQHRTHRLWRFRRWIRSRFRLFRSLLHPSSLMLRFARSSFGQISLIVADVTDPDSVHADFDAIVSVSALEHITEVSDFVDTISWVRRTGKPFWITTSAGRDETWWHEPSKGWCFGQDTMTAIGESVHDWFPRYDAAMASLRGSTYLRLKLPDYYRNNPNCGMPNGVWDPKYVPISISDDAVRPSLSSS